jgi:hypothetical protein
MTTDLLPIGPHDHPEPRTMAWTQVELAAIRDYAARCVAAERERCAKLCEDIGDGYQAREAYKWAEMKTDAQTGAHDCAAAIRQAGEKT